jgi:phage recombination protein Bet
MSTAVVTREFGRDEIELIKTTIARGATDNELSLFLNQCKRTGLDPFTKQIHAVKRWNSKTRQEEMQIQVGIDGLRLIAERTQEADGQEGPFWCGEDGVWVDAWLKKEPPMAAKVLVYRKGKSHPFTGVARYSSYVQTTKDGHPNVFWARMPDVMLAKCAESLALRKAFPQELSGLYSPEEMAHSSIDDAQIVAAPPEQIEHPFSGSPKPNNAPAPPKNGAELEAAARSAEAIWVRNGLCRPSYVLDRLTAWAREEMGCDNPMASWPADVVAAGIEVLKRIKADLKQPIGADEQKQLADMLGRKGLLWSAVIRAHSLPNNAAAKDLSRARWQTIMSQLEDHPDVEPARPATKESADADYEEVPF